MDQGPGQQLNPVRKIVSDDYGRDIASSEQDPRAWADAAGMVLRELYSRAAEADVRIDGWTVSFEPGWGSYGEGHLTATATHTTRKPLRLTKDDMEAEILRLLSIPRED